MDLVAYKMAEYMLDKAISADELRAAIETAIEHIEANPQASRASELRSTGRPVPYHPERHEHVCDAHLSRDDTDCTCRDPEEL